MSRIEQKLHHAMTVRDLIAELEGMDPEAAVLFTCDYGDHCHTAQALPVESVRELGECEIVEESAYSRSGLALSEIEVDDDADVNDAVELVMDAAERGQRPSVVILG